MTAPGLRILVGTADPQLARILGHTLEGEGHAVLYAPDARAAFHVLLTEPPDVVVLDVVLGDISGIEVARAVCQSPHAHRIRTLLLARDVAGTRLAVADLGVTVLGKPLDVLALTDLLRAETRRRAFGAPAPEPARAIPVPRRPARAPAPEERPTSPARAHGPRPSADKWALLGIPEGAVADEVVRAADALIHSLTQKAKVARSVDERTSVSATAARVRAARAELLQHLQAGRGS